MRFHAIEAIGRHGHGAASDRLIAIATSGDFFLAFPAIEALARIGDPLVAPRLSPLLDDPMLAGTVAEVLGRIGTEDAVEALVRALALPRYSRRCDCRRARPDSSTLPAIVRQRRRHRRRRPPHDFPGCHGARPRRVAARCLVTRSSTPIIVLSWIPDPLIPPALATLLGSADVRHEVIEAIGAVRRPGRGSPDRASCRRRRRHEAGCRGRARQDG